MTPINPLTDEQLLHIYNLRQSCQQAEDALTQGMEKLHQYLGEAVLAGQLGQGNYLPQMEAAMEKLEALVRFVNQVITLHYYVFFVVFISFFRTYNPRNSINPLFLKFIHAFDTPLFLGDNYFRLLS